MVEDINLSKSKIHRISIILINNYILDVNSRFYKPCIVIIKNVYICWCIGGKFSSKTYKGHRVFIGVRGGSVMGSFHW